MNTAELPPQQVLDAWQLRPTGITRLASGLINQTYRVESGGNRFVLQRVNPIFGPEIHDDIEAVTQHLESQQISTPSLIRTLDAALFVEHDGVWRLSTFIPGTTFLRVEHQGQVFSAGALLGTFHKALDNLDHEFRSKRTGVHDPDRHLKHLERVLENHEIDRGANQVRPLRDTIRKRLEELPRFHTGTLRITHGDPKISNILFDEDGNACCWVDLDTVGRAPMLFELGDAFRSWCNRGDEDTVQSHFDTVLFESALAGYLSTSGGGLDDHELDGIIDSVEMIALELASRFAADALTRTYFAWDRTRFPSALAHNLERARNQVALAHSVREQRTELEAIVARFTSQ